MKICEIFDSIQGEGRYQGHPMTFIRVSGCTKACSFCDTKFHIKETQVSNNDIIKRLNTSKPQTACFTGGEPLLYLRDIENIAAKTKKTFHIETNGDLIINRTKLAIIKDIFDYICVSPKEVTVAKRIYSLTAFLFDDDIDIKIVTDLDKVGVDMLKYATILMPLTTYNKTKDRAIRQRVWEYCIKKGLFYSMRLHTVVWGKKRLI